MASLNGICDAPEHVLIARDLAPADDDGAETRAEEGIARVRRVPWAEVLAMVGRAEITDAETLAALMVAGVRLGRIG
jgi:hypothetical protein